MKVANLVKYLLCALIAFSVARHANALEAKDLSVRVHTVTPENCQWIGGMLENVAMDRKEGVQADAAVTSLMVPQMLDSGEYRSLMPVMMAGIFELYQGRFGNTPGDVPVKFQEFCKPYLGKGLQYMIASIPQ